MLSLLRGYSNNHLITLGFVSFSHNWSKPHTRNSRDYRRGVMTLVHITNYTWHGTYYTAQGINVTSVFMNDCNERNNDHSRMDRQYIISWLLVVRLANPLLPDQVPRTSGLFILYPHHQYALVLCALSCGLESTFKDEYENPSPNIFQVYYCFNKSVHPIHESARCLWLRRHLAITPVRV